MKRPQLLILMLFVTLIAVFIYVDNSQLNLGRKMNRCINQLDSWQEMIKDKLPF